MKKIILPVVALTVVVALVFGVKTYVKKVRAAADKEARVQLREFYKLAGNGYPDAAAQTNLVRLIGQMEVLSKKCGPDMREALFARRLDGAFIVGDYLKAESLMDELPGKSENWKKGAKAKIRAHAAQDKGDKATALKEYGNFLASIRAEAATENEIDPYTGVEWTKEMIIARNLKRMASLAADIGEKDKAAALLAEAKVAFKAALEKAKDDAEMKAAIEKDAGDLLK
jgi:hypothetical protein